MPWTQSENHPVRRSGSNCDQIVPIATPIPNRSQATTVIYLPLSILPGSALARIEWAFIGGCGRGFASSRKKGLSDCSGGEPIADTETDRSDPVLEGAHMNRMLLLQSLLGHL